MIEGGDEANSTIDGVVSKAGNLAKSLGTGVAKAAATVGKTVAAGAAAGAAAVGALTKSAVDAYAEYEQLTGGVATLFEDLSVDVEDYANNAYKTAGLSANEYMETVTSFAATLNQSLTRLDGNIARSADVANLAITDMSDNANKMGTSMSAIQNAYQGFAKQNYTMLDNLKLGYGGTQQEMYRLLSDAKELDETFDAEFSLSAKGTLEAEFADIVEAIHIVQTNMGITGTTAKEAGSTISGSLAMTKSAWENLLVGIADPNQDMSALTENLISSATTAANNLLPRIGEIMGGIGEAVVDLAPQIGEAFSSITPMIGDALSGALSLAGIEISGEDITGALETAFSGLSDAVGFVQDIFSSIQGIVTDNMGGIVEAFSGIGGLVSGVFDAIVGVASKIDFSHIFGGLLDIINSVIGALSGIGSTIGRVIGNIASAFSGVDFGAIFDGLVSGITTAVEVIGSAFELIVVAVGAIVQPIAAAIGAVIEQCQTAGTTLNAVWSGITNVIQTAVGVIKGVLATLIAVLQGDFAAAGEAMQQTAQTIIDGLVQHFTNLLNMVSGIFSDISNFVSNVWENIKNGAKNTVENIKNFFKGLTLDPPKIDFSGLIDAARNAWNTIKSIFTSDSSSSSSGTTTVTASAKENADGAILKRATIFGKVGNTYQIGGEAGAEAVAPIDTLQGYVKSSVAEVMAGQNTASAEAFAVSAGAIVDELRTMTDEIVSALNNTSITINNRTFGRLVREV